MEKLKEYSKPLMIAEKFVPTSFCQICEDKHVEYYILSQPYAAYQHFVLDWNNNGYCDESDLDHIQTTDNSQPETIEIHYDPALCWPAKIQHPSSLSDVLVDEPLWYAYNPHNQSGHVYGYKTRTVVWSHS